MSLTIGPRLLDVTETHRHFPIYPEHQQFIGGNRREIEAILAGRDKRLIMIAGPCSMGPDISGENNPLNADYEYADRLAALQEEVEEEIKLVMRCYTQKPRTTTGWKGLIYQPNPLKPVDMRQGTLSCARAMHRLSKQVPLADEMLNVSNADVFDPFLSWVAVGARSAEDQPHREVVSGKDLPVGLKNPTSGDITIGVNNVVAAQNPHVFPQDGYQVTSSGNPFAHLVLRGGTNGSNYGAQAVGLATKLMLDKKVQNPAIIVDASHANSQGMNGKDPRLQDGVVASVMTGMKYNADGYQYVRGFMLESHIKEGKQSDKGPVFEPGLSITDACRGWEGTERLILKLAEMNANRRTV